MTSRRVSGQTGLCVCLSICSGRAIQSEWTSNPAAGAGQRVLSQPRRSPAHGATSGWIMSRTLGPRSAEAGRGGQADPDDRLSGLEEG